MSGTFDNFWIWILETAIGGLLADFAYDRLLLKGTPGDRRALIACGGTAPPFHHTARQRQVRWHERREQRARAARDGPAGRLARRDRDRAGRRRERPPDLPRARRRAPGPREHVRGHGVPALERAPARRRGARRPAHARGRRAWSCLPRCTTPIRSLGSVALPMDVLRTGLSVWGALRGRDEGGDSEDALWALAATPAIVADYARIRAGAAPLAPDPELGIVENYLLKLSGEPPDPAQARALDAYFILGAEHGMNASTFTARVIVSTLSDLASGLVGAVGALKGPLHGGAPSHVSHMIDEIGSPENAEPWLRRKLDARRGPDGLRPPCLPHLRPAGARARRDRRGPRGRERAARARAPRRGGRAAAAGRVQAGPQALHERRVLRGRRARRRRLCRPTSTPRRSPPRAPRAGRRTSSSNCSTTG